MTKILTLILIFTLLLVGCSKNKNDMTQSDTTTDNTSDTIDTPSPESDVETSQTIPQTVTVTIPEGFSVTQIASRLEANNVCDEKGFLNAINNYDFTYYPLVKLITNTDNRAFLLEGYLYPETYEFYTGESPENAIGRFLRQSEAMLTDIQAQAQEQGFTLDEILIIASIIQKECGDISQMEKVSAIIHNRLSINMRIQCDVTINYIEDRVKPFIDGDKDRYNSLYNTYKCDGLPAGPICNPSMSAIKAALNPDKDTSELFFFTDKEDNYIYSYTFEEHQQKINKAGI